MSQAIFRPALAAGTMGLSEAGGIIPILQALQPDISPPQASATPAPTTEDKAVQQAAAEAAQRRSRSRSFRSTILSKNLMESNAPALQTTLGS